MLLSFIPSNQATVSLYSSHHDILHTLHYLRHVHLFVLQYFVQLQQMTFSVSDGAAG